MKAVGLLLGLFILVPAFATGGASTGGDNPPMEFGSAWFLGSLPISYCAEVSPTFGTSPDAARISIRSALANWTDYISSYGPKYEAPFALDLNFSELPKCNGSEDLKFYLGATNDHVDKAKSKYFDPIAFSERTEYDLVKGRGKGFIWVKSNDGSLITLDWSKPFALVAVLMHEIGHVFGCPHIEGTLMTSEIYNSVLRATLSQDPHVAELLTRIDGTTALSNSWAQSVVPGVITDKPLPEMTGNAPPDETIQTFTRMTGRQPVGKVGVELTGLGTKELKLVLSDELGVTPLLLGALVQQDFIFGVSRIADAFLTVRTLGGNERVGAESSSTPISVNVIPGWIQAFDGTRLNILFQLNFNSAMPGYMPDAGGAIRIQYLENGVGHSLFHSILE